MRTLTSILSVIALIAFTTSCGDSPSAPVVPTVGQLKVKVVTTGGDIDPVYWVSVDSVHKQIFENGGVTVTVPSGSATVDLTDVAANCVVDGATSISVKVTPPDTANVLFRVTCYPTGFQITLRTTGFDIPFDAFVLQLKGSASGTLPVAVGPNASFTITRLEPGSYSLRLDGLAERCSAASGHELNVVLPPRTVVQVKVDITCVEPVRLEKIAYTVDSTWGNVTSFLALSNPDGTQRSIIGPGLSPSWSPDGKNLVYANPDCANYYYYYYFTCPRTLVAIDPETLRYVYLGNGDTPAWAPIGNLVAFVTSDGLLAVTPATLPSPSLVPIPKGLFASDPAWSPDGQTIAFGCRTSTGSTRLCVVNKDGSGFRQLTDSTADRAYHPAWSHDGGAIVFNSVSVSRSAIAIIPASGGAITVLAEGFDPAWSRDGTSLIFARADGLFTMNADGTNQKRVTTGKQRAPAWRP